MFPSLVARQPTADHGGRPLTRAELTAALKLAAPIGDRIGLARIRGVRAGFPEPWDELDCVRELDQRLRPAA
ncbi:MAG: hypothetical protein ACRDYX_11785 [Egibacteraceae bacterium]